MTNEQKLHQILLKISKSGRSTSYSTYRGLTATRTGILLRDEYHAAIFHRHSTRIEATFEGETIESLIEDISRFAKEKRLEWIWDEIAESDIREPF